MECMNDNNCIKHNVNTCTTNSLQAEFAGENDYNLVTTHTSGTGKSELLTFGGQKINSHLEEHDSLASGCQLNTLCDRKISARETIADVGNCNFPGISTLVENKFNLVISEEKYADTEIYKKPLKSNIVLKTSSSNMSDMSSSSNILGETSRRNIIGEYSNSNIRAKQSVKCIHTFATFPEKNKRVTQENCQLFFDSQDGYEQQQVEPHNIIWKSSSLDESKPYLTPNAELAHHVVVYDGITLPLDEHKAKTLFQHYYTEGGWGWIVCICVVLAHFFVTGLQCSFGLLLLDILERFNPTLDVVGTVCLGTFSTCIALFLSPVIMAICRRRSARLIAVLGGLITALGCLFTSFASQFHQLFVSYGLFVGCGVCMIRDAATLIIGQYFKRKRELVEIAIFCGAGFGMTIIPVFLSECIRAVGWRLGLQTVTGIVSITFILGFFYRPASLYHPQRRAILHLRDLLKRLNARDKQGVIDKTHFFHFEVLKSRTVQILFMGTVLTTFGAHTPIILLIHQCEKEGLDYQSLLLLQAFLGIAFVLGSGIFGFIVVRNRPHCIVSRQYLCQIASFMISASLLVFTTVEEYKGYLLFVWIYGLFYGGYTYSLKMYTLEKVRARNFSRAWGFIQWAQAIPFLIGIPVVGYINEHHGGRTGLYLSSVSVFLGSMTLFLIDIHKRSVEKRKMSVFSGDRRCSSACLDRDTFSCGSSFQDSALVHNMLLPQFQQHSLTFSNFVDLQQQELTCISEEVAMENFFEDLMNDCITSCNREEKYLMLSEYEQNLMKTREGFKNEKLTKTDRNNSVSNPSNLEICPNCLKYISSSTNDGTDHMPFIATSVRQNEQQMCSTGIIEEITTTV
ncbi:monocarboxylate transporter 10-like [Tachypleus tridentatus]|uniref:monocarboxylate transporter 10-like n=1 Tax=Tachypleus tridentatus TaxID=6853 RepID=UPI003FD0E0CE